LNHSSPFEPSFKIIIILSLCFFYQSLTDLNGCVHANMGCVECKQPVIESVQAELLPMQERIAKYQADPSHIKQ
jgi:tryptophanyl-tRNA synthetase